MRDPFFEEAIKQAKIGLLEGGIPIGSVIVHKNKILGAGHNKRVQEGSVVLHGEMDALENAGRLEIYQLEKNVSILATISGAGPMIGFLGTVIGMILAIFELANAGGTIQMDVLASGLYTAMTTTVAGLIVGIVAFMAFNHLVVKTDKVVYQMEANSLEFLDHLNEPS
mgnify:CR=1 FL=1